MLLGTSNMNKNNNLHVLNAYCMSDTVLIMEKYTSETFLPASQWASSGFVKYSRVITSKSTE